MTEAATMGSSGRRFAMLVAGVSFSALVLQYALLILLTFDTVGPAFATVRFFSYFTILSNLLVTCVAACAAFGMRGRWAGWFARPGVRGGVAVYIAVTGAVYFLILRHLWQPQGAQWWADSGLHYATPVLYMTWWMGCVPHGRLGWGALPRWLLFPGGYLLWCLVRGAVVREYPYPFIDVGQLGLPTMLRNSAGVLLLILGMGALVVLLDRVLGRSRVGSATA